MVQCLLRPKQMILVEIIYWVFTIGIIIVPNLALYFLIKEQKKGKRLMVPIIFTVAIMFNFFVSFWGFRIFPGSKDYYARQNVIRLTGQKIDVENIYNFDEPAGIHGEGFTLDYDFVATVLYFLSYSL